MDELDLVGVERIELNRGALVALLPGRVLRVASRRASTCREPESEHDCQGSTGTFAKPPTGTRGDQVDRRGPYGIPASRCARAMTVTSMGEESPDNESSERASRSHVSRSNDSSETSVRPRLVTCASCRGTSELEQQVSAYEHSRTVALAIEGRSSHRGARSTGIGPTPCGRRHRAGGRVATRTACAAVHRRRDGAPTWHSTPQRRAGSTARGSRAGRRRPKISLFSATASASWSLRPLISVCMPVYNPDPKWLAQAIESVQSQSYENWELCICDDASTRRRCARRSGRQGAARTPASRLIGVEANGGISRATNGALARAQGEFVAFLDDDDFIEPHTLFLMVRELQADATIDLFYCDEDVLLVSGERAEPYLKPGWSPEALLSMNYITHFVVARRSLVTRLGGLRPERDGGQDHDLVLRLSELTDAIWRVPEVLYTWRQSPGSTSMSHDAKRWAFDASVEVGARRGRASQH